MHRVAYLYLQDTAHLISFAQVDQWIRLPPNHSAGASRLRQQQNRVQANEASGFMGAILCVCVCAFENKKNGLVTTVVILVMVYHLVYIWYNRDVLNHDG